MLSIVFYWGDPVWYLFLAAGLFLLSIAIPLIFVLIMCVYMLWRMMLDVLGIWHYEGLDENDQG